jgi:DNA-binding MarR family transcriptional regulator
MDPVTTPCVCTTLRMATRSVARRYDYALAEVGIRQVAYTILARLHAEGPMSVNELAGRLSLDRTTCSREVVPLAEAGFIEIDRGVDRRRRLLQLSDAGVAKVAQARPHWHRIQAEIERSFGSAETSELLTALRILLHTTEALPVW